jgi:hypothetical protein
LLFREIVKLSDCGDNLHAKLRVSAWDFSESLRFYVFLDIPLRYISQLVDFLSLTGLFSLKIVEMTAFHI